MNAPCKNCERREPLCHSKCPDYKEFKEYNNKMKEDLRKRRDMDYAISYHKRRKR